MKTTVSQLKIVSAKTLRVLIYSKMHSKSFDYLYQAHALDGAIFPWMRDTRAFLLLNHLEIFACILSTSNQMIFLVQFGINKHS